MNTTAENTPLKFDRFISTPLNDENVRTLGLIFQAREPAEDAPPANYRAAIIYRIDWTPEEFGRALETLGKALRTGEGVRTGDERLVGHELNAADFPGVKEEVFPE